MEDYVAERNCWLCGEPGELFNWCISCDKSEKECECLEQYQHIWTLMRCVKCSTTW